MQEQQVKNYKNQRAFQKDAAKLLKQGWMVQAQNSYQPRGLIFAKRQQIVVTYTRARMNVPPPLAEGRPGYAVDGRRLTLRESIQQAKAQRNR